VGSPRPSRLLVRTHSDPSAAVAAARCADLDQVAVVADTLQHLQPGEGFGLVTLVGVLEYARLLFPAEAGADPVDSMLARARELLAADGALLLAIENPLGLKYFAGCAEDHEAVPMVGIEDRYRRDGVVPFGRAELGARLAAAGLGATRWWYPFPDYKLPVAVLSEAAVAGDHGLDLTPEELTGKSTTRGSGSERTTRGCPFVGTGRGQLGTGVPVMFARWRWQAPYGATPMTGA